MSTRSSARNLFPPHDNPELTIRRRSRADPTLLNKFEMAIEGNGDPPVPDLRTMEELCQPSLNGREIKVNGATDDAFRLYLFPHSLIHLATAWFNRLPRNSINTFEQMAKMFLGKYFPPSMVTKLRNEITNFSQRPDESLFEAWEHYKLSIDRCPNHNMFPVTQTDAFYNRLTLRHHDTINAAAGGTFMKRRPKECYDLIENMTTHHNDWDTSAQRITPNCETYGGPHSFSDCPATVGQTQNVYAAGAYQGGNSYQPQGANHGPNPPPAYQVPAYKAPDYQAPVHQPSIPQPQVVTTAEFINYMKANDAILKNMQTNMTSLKNSNLELKNMFGQFMKMITASSSGSRTLPSNTVINPKEDLKGITTQSGTAYQGPTIPTTSSSLPNLVECRTEVTKDTVPLTNNESTKDIQPLVVQIETPILNSEPVVAPIIEPVVAPVSAPKPNQKPSIPYPSRLYDQKLRDKTSDRKEKIFTIFQDLNFRLASQMLTFSCQILLKKLPEKLGDPDKFLIPCDFPGMVECLALADLGASINLKPLSVWNKRSLPELTPTLMTLELEDRLICRPIGVAEDVYVNVGKFHFPADFVVVDFDADPRVPLILERSFLKTGRALIVVFKGELSLRVGREAITFNLDQTSRYSANYNDMMANRIDVIDMACEEYSQEVIGFSDVIISGNLTPYYDSIVSTSFPTLTPFEDSDFLLEEVDAFLALEDDATSPEVDQSYYNPEGDILLLKAFLNDDPSLPSPTQGNYLPQVQKELKNCEAKNDKSSIDEPLEVELKDLPPHLEYAFLEGDNKLPIIIAKDLSEEEKATKKNGQSKIHNVIKKEVLKLLDARLIYPISDNPWVSPVHCVPKKGGFTVVENEENELILTRLVTGWCICIDYRKLNEATCKDHFPLPFMDQMLERLAGNEYYCFLDGFSDYFQIPIDPKDQEKTTFTYPYGMFAYRRMPFGLCNASGTFKRCKMAIFHYMIEKTMEVFMDDFSIFRNSFRTCLSHLEKMLKRSAVLGKHQEKYFRTIHYASKTMTEAEFHYTTTKKEILAVVYAFEKFWSYLIMNKSIVYTDHSALKYLFAKKDFKARLLRWVLLLQEFTFKVIDTKGAENLALDHLSQLKNPHQNVLDQKAINETFPLETLNMVSFCGIPRILKIYAKGFVLQSSLPQLQLGIINGDPPVPGLRTIKELCQPTLNGRGGPIAPIVIQATNFGLKNDMI
nr:reverse transcriptase domain-containing protein [Tanacetum cinerariifolium]